MINREEIEKGIIEIINEQVFVPKMVAGLEAFITDYIQNLLERQAEESYDRYYNINQEEE